MATVIAKETVRVAGPGRVMVVKGNTYDDKDKVVKDNRWLFESPDDFAVKAKKPKSTADLGDKAMSTRKKKTVEQATAAPGEQRDVTYGCEECDFASTSEHGLKVHVSKAHG